MTEPFTYHSDPVRVVLGPGAAKALRAEADRHKFSRIVVLCSKTRTDFTKAVIAPVAERVVGFCDTGGEEKSPEQCAVGAGGSRSDARSSDGVARRRIDCATL